MIHISRHAIHRFVQRHYKRGAPVTWVKKSDIKEAEHVLTRWLENATPLENNQYLYNDVILVCQNNTIITMYPKEIVRKG